MWLWIASAWDALLYYLHIKDFPVDRIYRGYVTGAFSADGALRLLRKDQINEFITFHECAKAFVSGEDPNPNISKLLPSALKDPNRANLALLRVDTFIEKNFEEHVE